MKVRGATATFETVAERQQGRFRVPDTQKNLCHRFCEPLYCPACGEHTIPQQDERLECMCGALWTFTLGESAGEPYVVKMERWR